MRICCRRTGIRQIRNRTRAFGNWCTSRRYDNYFHGSKSNLIGLTPWHADNYRRRQLRIQSNVLESIRSTSPDFVINCIGDTFVPTAYSYPRRFFDINLGCNLNILRAAKQCCVSRVVYVSSTEVYGSVGQERISESQSLNPLNTYAVFEDCR